SRNDLPSAVIPLKKGIHKFKNVIDARLREHDGKFIRESLYKPMDYTFFMQTIINGLSSGKIEGSNNKIKTIHKVAYGSVI
ncbi:MAG: transposase, partial [Ghiorsea sp.]|nr:transposase [Ghiorsea sp.]